LQIEEERLAPHKALAADQGSVASVLSTLSLNAERLVDDKVSDLASYGLVASSLEVAVTLKKQQDAETPRRRPDAFGQRAYYAILAEDPRLFTIARASTRPSRISATRNCLTLDLTSPIG
jgi:hypothetical protein